MKNISERKKLWLHFFLSAVFLTFNVIFDVSWTKAIWPLMVNLQRECLSACPTVASWKWQPVCQPRIHNLEVTIFHLKLTIFNLRFTIQRECLSVCPTVASWTWQRVNLPLIYELQFTIYNSKFKIFIYRDHTYIWMNVPLKHPLTTLLPAYNSQFTMYNLKFPRKCLLSVCLLICNLRFSI